MRLLVVMLSLGSSVSSPPGAHALELNSLSQERLSELERQFKQASRPNGWAQVVGKHWNCTIYGTNSRLTEVSGKMLYHFKNAPRNFGHHIFKTDYRFSDEGLIGQKGPLRDTLRMTSDSRLIAHLSVKASDIGVAAKKAPNNSSIGSANQKSLSIAVCKDIQQTTVRSAKAFR